MTTWRKSSRSNSDGACVEARSSKLEVAMRDSKDAAGPVLAVPAEAWSAFTAAVRDGRFEA